MEAKGQGEREPGWAMGTEVARGFFLVMSILPLWRWRQNEPLAQMRPLKRPAGACRHEAGRRAFRTGKRRSFFDFEK